MSLTSVAVLSSFMVSACVSAIMLRKIKYCLCTTRVPEIDWPALVVLIWGFGLS